MSTFAFIHGAGVGSPDEFTSGHAPTLRPTELAAMLHSFTP